MSPPESTPRLAGGMGTLVSGVAGVSGFGGSPAFGASGGYGALNGVSEGFGAYGKIGATGELGVSSAYTSSGAMVLSSQLQEQSTNIQEQQESRLVPMYSSDTRLSPYSSPLNLPKPTTYGGGLYLSSEDHLVSRQVEERHAPDGRQVDVRPLLTVVQDILTNATTQADQAWQQKQTLDSQIMLSAFQSMPDLPLIIERISCEMSGSCCGGGVDAHSVTLSVLNKLTPFTWEAKLLLTLAAFAMTYGEFLLLSQIYATNPLAKSVALLKQLPTVLEHSDTVKRQFDAIRTVIKAMLDVTFMVVEFNETSAEYVSQDEPAVQAVLSQFPTAVYWIVRSAIAAATQITVFTTSSQDSMPSTNDIELFKWANKLTSIHAHIERTKTTVTQVIESKKKVETFIEIKRIIYTRVHTDNMTVLKTLIYAKDDIQPLQHGSTKRRVNLDVLKEKTVLFLISSLDISTQDIAFLEKIQKESPTQAYEIVWMPVVDRTAPWDDYQQAKFENLQSMMPWYTVHHPHVIDEAVIRFFREELHFVGKPVLAAFDTQGKVLCPNALPMMWIWGSQAFPFTHAREEILWKQESWNLDLIVGSIDQTVKTWIQTDKHVVMFGGDDIEWIRRFTREVRNVAQTVNLPIELLYVGKPSRKQDVESIILTIENDNLATVWKDTSKMWFFWNRLETMLRSKIQFDKVNGVFNDTVTRELKKLISYESSAAGSWALLAKGPNILASGTGTAVYTTLQEFKKWKPEVDRVGFEAAFFNLYISSASSYCSKFGFSGGASKSWST